MSLLLPHCDQVTAAVAGARHVVCCCGLLWRLLEVSKTQSQPGGRLSSSVISLTQVAAYIHSSVSNRQERRGIHRVDELLRCHGFNTNSMPPAEKGSSCSRVTYMCQLKTNCSKDGSGTIKLKSCMACRLVKYCSVDCQNIHCKKHKKACKKRAAELQDEELSSTVATVQHTEPRLYVNAKAIQRHLRMFSTYGCHLAVVSRQE